MDREVRRSYVDHEFERDISRSTIHLGIVRIRQDSDVLVPIALVIFHVAKNHGFGCPVVPFRLAVGLSMIRTSVLVLNLHDLVHSLEHFLR